MRPWRRTWGGRRAPTVFGMEFPPPVPDPLVDGELSLRRYDSADAAVLFRALHQPDVWEHLPREVPRNAEALDAQLKSKLTDGLRVTYTVRSGDRVLGTTSVIFDPADHEGVEIGATQLDRAVWGTGVNTQVKHPLTAALFDAGAQWIQFRTDERNLRSAAAKRKLGESISVSARTTTSAEMEPGDTAHSSASSVQAPQGICNVGSRSAAAGP